MGIAVEVFDKQKRKYTALDENSDEYLSPSDRGINSTAQVALVHL